jgi:3-hydroxyacyl-CoA dehydrogenase
MSHVDYQPRGAVAVIGFGDPPVNSLGHATRREIAEALDQAAADAAIGAIVLTGRNGMFSGGADIREFGTPLMTRAPHLGHLIAMVEASAKPVIAAIGGTCLGGGFELSMACHYRVANSEATVGLPEVKLGLLPGASGTQRLPRLVGVETALNIILSGEPVPAKLLKATRLFDRIVDGDPVQAAVDLATSLASESKPPRRVSDLQVVEPNLEALCQFARNAVRAKFANYPAPLRCIDAVQASIKPFKEGFELERSYFLELLETPQSKSLRHAFFAERAAARIPDVPGSTPTREIRKAAVIGAGTMGSGITICFLNAGIPVALLETDAGALERAVARLRAVYEGQVSKGKLSASQRDARLALLSPGTSFDATADADIAVEAVFEELDAKEKVFHSLDGAMKPGAILATNTSTLDVNRIAAFTRRPQDVIGTHFFSPANVMRLLEVVRGEATSKEVLATVMKLGKKLGKTAVVSGVCDGFIGNRMIEKYSEQAVYLLEAGASPRQVDSAAEAFGFAMGPFRMSDLAGNDIGWHIRKRHRLERPDRTYSTLPDKVCELGRFGQKTQAGWYDYKPGDRSAHPSRVVEEIITQHRAELGIQPRRIESDEIVDRLVYSLVNEGAKILEEGIAARASDIDMVYLTGYGFPLWRGGPMFYADLVGLYDVVRRMNQFAADTRDDPKLWAPAPLLARLAAEGGSFNTTEQGAA